MLPIEPAITTERPEAAARAVAPTAAASVASVSNAVLAAPLRVPAAETGRRILILANPIAGTFRRVRLDTLARRLSLAGHDVDVHLTRHAGDISEIVAAGAAAIDVIVIAGGDGSVNEALTGLADIADPPALAILPFGTANVLALEVGLPRRAKRLAEVIDAGATMPLHFGLANGRAFVLMASAGFDAAVVHALRRGLKRQFGKVAYAVTAAEKLFGSRDADVIVTAGGVSRRTRLAIVTNVARYGGPFVLASEAHPGRPGFHLVTIDDDRPWTVAKLVASLLVGRVGRQDGVRIEPVDHVRLGGLMPIPAQIDGDPFGTTPLEIVPAPRPVPLIVPPAQALAVASDTASDTRATAEAVAIPGRTA